jgi:hypothetical protein
MTVQDVQEYYGYDWRAFVKRGGGSRRSWFRYQADGVVPFPAQLRLQRKTRGKLKAEKVGGDV